MLNLITGYLTPSLRTTSLMSSRSIISPFAFASSSRSLSSLRGGANDEDPFPTWSFGSACKTMEVSSLPPVSFNIIRSPIPDVADLGGPVVFGFKGNEEKHEGTFELGEGTPEGKVDRAFGGIFTQSIEENAKDFKNGTSPGASIPLLTIPNSGSIIKATITSCGSKFSTSSEIRKSANSLASSITSVCESTKCSTLHVSLPSEVASSSDCLKSIVVKSLDLMYRDNRYRTGENEKDPFESLTTVNLYSPSFPSTSESVVEAATSLNAGSSLCKDLVNSPPNILNPLSMADLAQRIAKESGGNLKCEVWGSKECEKRSMGAYLGVARGSETEPQFIHLTYTPSGKAERKLAVVGKGLTFDAGGYNIKTQMMELMKFDMGGSAATLGSALAISKLAPPKTEVHFIVAACENMVSERAMRPGDVLTASNGMTIEVLNTDAEGRLTLADALVFADKEVGADKIIDLATLTGACMVALGDQVAGVWTDDDDLAKSLQDSSEESGDKTWRMPLEMGYDEQLKSKIADMTNLGGRYGGAITAALFLKKFVDGEKPYAHIDIAGPVWSAKTGATGHGAKLVAEWILKEDEGEKAE